MEEIQKPLTMEWARLAAPTEPGDQARISFEMGEM
jgi:hypothetical protein